MCPTAGLVGEQVQGGTSEPYSRETQRLGVLPAPPRKLEAVVDAISRAALLLCSRELAFAWEEHLAALRAAKRAPVPAAGDRQRRGQLLQPRR